MDIYGAAIDHVDGCIDNNELAGCQRGFGKSGEEFEVGVTPMLPV